MDPSSEYSFFNTVLEEDDKSKTMIFVSHRLKIASKMNRIIYLENGKIVGIGTHQQLMTGCEKYRRYYVSLVLMEDGLIKLISIKHHLADCLKLKH